MTQPLIPADIFAFQSVAEARIAPDGSRIVATLTRRDPQSDRRRTVLIETRDRVTWRDLPGSAGVVGARFAPDGRLAVLRRDEAGMALVVLDDRERVLHRSATPLREIAWSPDGRLIAFQGRVDAPPPDWLGLLTPPEGGTWGPPPKHTSRLLYRHDAVGEMPEATFHVFVVPADGSALPRQITEGPWHNGLPHHFPPGLAFTPEGSEVLLAGTQRRDWDLAPNEVDIHAIAVADGRVRRLTDIAGPTAFVAPSPDGRLIAFTAVHQRGLCHQLRRLHVMAAEGGEAREVLPKFDRSINDVAWTADSAALLVTYEDAGETHLARVTPAGALTVLARDLGSGQIEKPYGGGATFSLARDGTIAYVRTAVDLPSEVAVLAPGAAPATLTALNAGLADRIGGFRPARSFHVAGGEGRQVQCWLMLPDGPGPHPLVLEIHGGPFHQYGARFSIKYQMLAAAGYAVLFANPAGSTGYGEDFANALNDRFPGPDYDDLMAAVDAVVERAEIDAGRLYVTGTSGGGLLTLWAVTHAERFRAAVAIKPVTDWQSWVLGADIGPSVGRTWMGHTLPWEAPEKYRARSPLTYAQQARTPTLLMAGESDARTPPSETTQMYAALRLAGVEAHLLRFPGTPHGTGAMRPSLFAAECAATIGWFNRFR